MSSTLGAPLGAAGSAGHHGVESRQLVPMTPLKSCAMRRSLPQGGPFVRRCPRNARVKLGLQLGYWGAQPNPFAVSLAQEAERLGFDSVWTAEAWGSDAVTPLAWIGPHTQTIRLCTGILQISARNPASCAMHALTRDHLSNGRFTLG